MKVFGENVKSGPLICDNVADVDAWIWNIRRCRCTFIQYIF